MDLALILPPDGPRGARLVEALREAILTGRVPPGEPLPATRLLAAQLRLSRGTVVAAYEELTAEGYCEARVGAGTFVSGRLPACVPATRPEPGTAGPAGRLSAWGERLTRNRLGPLAPPEPCFDFRGGPDPEIVPTALLGPALRRALDAWPPAGPGEPAGNHRLRAALVSWLSRTRGLRADAGQAVIVSGTQQGIDLAARLLLDPGDRVCMEEPGYPRARQVFAALGAQIVPVPVDAGGLRTERLPADGARLVYVTPSHQHPTGAVLAPERRLALLEWANRHGAWVLEDDYDSEFRYGGPPLPCLQGLDRSGRCLYVGSLSKLLHPALRLGHIIVPPALVEATAAAKGVLDQANPSVLQEALAGLFESGDVAAHLRRAMRRYQSRRSRLLAACARHLPDDARLWPVTGGLHAWLELPGITPARLFEEALARGVAFAPGSDCYHGPPPGATLILWFSRIPPDDIEPGIAALAAAIEAAR